MGRAFRQPTVEPVRPAQKYRVQRTDRIGHTFIADFEGDRAKGNIVDPEQRLLRQYRVVVQQSLRLPEDLANFEPATPSSTHEHDRKALKSGNPHTQRVPRRRILHANMQQYAHKAANVCDHLVGLHAVLGLEPLRPYTPMTMTRVAIEAAAGAAYLLDTSVDTDERVLRAAGMLLESFKSDLSAAREITGPLGQKAVVDTSSRLTKLAEQTGKAGLVVRHDTSGLPNGLQWPGAPRFRPIPPVKISDMVKNAFASFPALYPITSGVAHSMAWMLQDNARLPTDGSQAMLYLGDPFAAGAATITAISAAEVVITAFGRYMGHDPEDVLVLYRRRRESLNAMMSEYFEWRGRGRPRTRSGDPRRARH